MGNKRENNTTISYGLSKWFPNSKCNRTMDKEDTKSSTLANYPSCCYSLLFQKTTTGPHTNTSVADTKENKTIR